ncbi:MarR family winged helix-turn-helix transcriptional regulator [Achromobacter insuavis]|uniref:MarR family winged helix-turn-helix transcriptional regulator n=1 Tax=Achromobacter insuavis TaxID=1287735 RepID=UPI001F12EF04|nr:MarR family winged helix-turn-helix transcriptional regulator [Achromobacter insuavis]
MRPKDIPPGLCNSTAIRKAARHLGRFYDSHLAQVDLRGTQYAILNLLAARGPQTIAALAESLVTDRATMGHNLRPLERDGLVRIAVGKQDRREREIALTDVGRDAETAGRMAWQRAQQQFEAAFGKEDALAMRRIMHRITTLALAAPD